MAPSSSSSSSSSAEAGGAIRRNHRVRCLLAKVTRIRRREEDRKECLCVCVCVCVRVSSRRPNYPSRIAWLVPSVAVGRVGDVRCVVSDRRASIGEIDDRSNINSPSEFRPSTFSSILARSAVSPTLSLCLSSDPSIISTGISVSDINSAPICGRYHRLIVLFFFLSPRKEAGDIRVNIGEYSRDMSRTTLGRPRRERQARVSAGHRDIAPNGGRGARRGDERRYMNRIFPSN